MAWLSLTDLRATMRERLRNRETGWKASRIDIREKPLLFVTRIIRKAYPAEAPLGENANPLERRAPLLLQLPMDLFPEFDWQEATTAVDRRSRTTS